MAEKSVDNTKQSGMGPSLDRRRLLLGLGAAGGAIVSVSTARADGCPMAAAGVAATPLAAIDDRQPFHGIHQAGITSSRPPAGLVVAFDVLVRKRSDLQRLMRTLTDRIAFLMEGGAAPMGELDFPPPDSGLLGPVVSPDNLTITVAVGASLFDDRFGLAGVKPARLTTMHQFPNDALEADRCHGDLLLQICSNTAETNIHALRDVVKHTPDLLMVRWQQDGFVPAPREPGERKESPRNMLGFKDGTANPDSSDAALMDRIVWVRRNASEQGWAAGGTYQVVRVIRNFVERWDRTRLVEQQTIIGRDKYSGAPLTMKAERDVPPYADDPKGNNIPLNAHIRLANPRTAATDPNLILRRPFNYSRGVTKAGQLDMGLLFICFQADLDAGFIAVQNRLNGEPLEEYIKPVGGGYFFALPGVPDQHSYLGQSMLEAAGRFDQSEENPSATKKGA